LRDYLSNGGIVITEFSASDEIYALAFPDSNVRQGPRRGGCSDQIAPQIRLNTGDPFWRDNANVQNNNNSGCGYDMVDFPDNIVPLGGWSNDSVSHAYVNFGAGRLYLVESDWQDSEAAQSAESLQLMRYMISNRR
jgi:hypothetical protein